MPSTLSAPALFSGTSNSSTDPGLVGLTALLELAGQAGCWCWREAAGQDPHAPWQWTPGLARLLRWPEGDTPPWREPADLLVPEDRLTLQQTLQTLQPGQQSQLQALAWTADGQRLDVRLWLRCSAEAGRRIDGVVQDISEFVRLERESKRVRVQLSTTLASMTEAFATLDGEGRFTYVNEQTCAPLQRSSAQLLGRRLWRELDDQGSG
jgi:PAS domain-containing protein